MNVEFVDSMGTDLTVINAARVSFDKYHELFTGSDEKLIAYLAKQGHWTPFGYPQLQFRIAAPIFVARQLVKHHVGLVWNEISRKYIDSKPRFYTTDRWRSKAKDKKQGSGKGFIELTGDDYSLIQTANETSLEAYNKLLSKGAAPEQARMVLPQSMYTDWHWTGSLYAFARICKLRMSEDAQEETRYVAQKISTLIDTKFPISWQCLMKESNV